MPVDTSFYPKPSQPQNPLASIVQTVQGAEALGKAAAGSAVQQAIDPDTGQIDQNKVAGLLKQAGPIGGMAAAPTLDALARLRQAGYASDQAALDTFQKRMAVTHHLFSGLASKTKPTMDDVYDVAASALDPKLEAKKYGITMPVVMSSVKMLRDAFNRGGPQALRQKALEIQTMAATTAEVLQQHSPGYQVVNQGGQLTIIPTGTAAKPAIGTAVPLGLPPTTPVATPEGTQYLGEQPAVPGGGAVGPTGEPVVPGAPPVPAAGPRVPRGPAASLPPGFPEAAAGIGGASAASANRLTEANDTAMGRKAILGNLEDLVGKFKPGVGANWELVAKNFANRNLPIPKTWKESGGVLDVKSVASQEEFNKLAVQLAQQQFSTIGGTGTDAKFSSAFETSPNDTLSRLGNQMIIKLLKGNEDAIIAKNKAWQQWLRSGKGPQTYAQFSANFNEHFDPRVFQFKYIDAKDRQAYVDAMDDNDRDKFLHDLTYARKKGWVSFEQPKAK